MNTKTRELFRSKVRAHGGSGPTARDIGCTRAYVDMIMKGERSPGMRTAHAIERIFGIPMRAWMEPDAPAQAESHPSTPSSPSQ